MGTDLSQGGGSWWEGGSYKASQERIPQVSTAIQNEAWFQLLLPIVEWLSQRASNLLADLALVGTQDEDAYREEGSGTEGIEANPLSDP